MKLAFISDIHGNYHALEAVLEDIRRQQAERIYVLGDLVFKGPLPERCVQAVRALNTVVLQGNIDELVGKNVIQPGFAKSSEHEAAIRKEMSWTRARLAAEELEYLAQLPFSHEVSLPGELSIRLVHATPQNVLDIVLPTDGEEKALGVMFAGTTAQVVIYGHIHQPYIRCLDGRTLINTGSVGLPFDGNPAASYALVETDEPVGKSGAAAFTASIRRVPYDVGGALAAFEGSGHPYAESVMEAIKTGRRPV
ncbi:MAG: phosphodiesterase [Paenibacillaceae bacterium]|jgi:putative phosphoesterase|nr:phosphodiesterase [Paenibacillaceae bacterium]